MDMLETTEALEKRIAKLTIGGKPDANQQITRLRCSMGINHMLRGEFDEAIEAYRKAIAISPDRPDTHCDLGSVYRKAKRDSDAVESYLAALQLCPTHTAALQNLARIRLKEKNVDEAERLCRKAIESSTGDCAIAHEILAQITHAQGDVSASQQHFAESLQEGNGNHSAKINFMMKLIDSQKKKKSKSAKKDQNEMTPMQLNNEMICESIRTLRNTLKLNPTDADALGQLNTSLQVICDWKDLDDRMKILSAVVDDQIRKNLDPPVDSYSAANMFPISLQQQLAIASYFSQQLVKESKEPLIQYHLSEKRLRIGYFVSGSSRFPLVGSRSKFNSDRFEVFYYCLFDDPTLRQTLVGYWDDHVIDLSTFGDSSRDAANRIASDGIQILINLVDSFQNIDMDNASVLLAHRPVPIQAVYRSSIGSTGASYVDYFITDQVASPLKFAYGYSEKLAYMPNGMFACNKPEWLIKPQANLKELLKCRKRFRLPESAIVFGVNSSSFMIDPVTFWCWCEILLRVSGSVIWFLLPYLEETQLNLKKEAKRHKINPHRLIFSPHRLIFTDQSLVGLDDLIPIDQLISVILDTSMRNADGLAFLLSKEIPIVTLPGESFTSRLTASLLTSIGCEELIAKSKWFYIEIAVNLGNQPELLQQMKDRICENLPDSNLFDVDKYFNDLGNLYEKMWKLKEMGKNPEHIV